MYAINTPIYQSKQIREFEKLAQERFSITSSTLMQRAGKAAFEFLLRRWPQAQKIAIFCGGGNNGGDGYVIAALAHARALQVTIYQVGSQDNLSEAAKAALETCQKADIPIHIFNPHEDLHHPDLMIDALCGIGLKDPLRENMVEAIEKMEQAEVPILSIDVPTGIDADTGTLLGTAVHATATVTFIGLKLGLLTNDGTSYTGELICNDLQLPAELFACIEPIAKKMNINTYAKYLKPRQRNWHKGLSGHVLIIGGDIGYSGAPRMAAQAALRVGAGLVSVATHPENAIVMNADFPEIMCHGVGVPEELEKLIAKADVLVIGPGLGQSSWSKGIWDIVSEIELPKVIDADGLHFLAKINQVSNHWVLTPHPGEAGRLLNITTSQVQANRLGAVNAIQKRYGGSCVLKGSGSLVLTPDSLPSLCDKGNPGMASAGMGDVLSGVLGGLMGQRIPLGEAAKLGVCIHAMAGDLAAKEGERGMIATDLMPYLRRLANYLP